MTLGLALSNALSGLSLTQRSLAATSGNITNASTEGYTRKSVQAITQVTAGQGVGANPELRRIVDDFLGAAQRSQNTSVGKAAVVKEYMERIQVYLGKPGEDGAKSIMSELDAFFSAAANVSASPEQSFFRTQAVQRGADLANTISGLANNLQKTRFQAEQEINTSISNVNNILDRLSAINVALRESFSAQQPQEELFDQRDKTLKELMQYMDVGVTIRDSGEVGLFNQAGELLSGSRYHITYSPAGSVETFRNDKKLGKMEIVALNEDGTPADYRITLSTEGLSSQVTTKIADGKLKGLMEVRDVEIPKMLAQLDSLANGLREEMNKIHNDGIGFPPPSSLTGTRQLRPDQEVAFAGSVRIAALTATGKPAASPYNNDPGSQFPPLKLDFSKIHGAAGQGRPALTDVMNEINQYYDAPATRVQMGTLADVRLIAVSDNTTGPFEFELEFANGAKTANSVTVVSINAVAVGGSVNVPAGEVNRSNIYSVAGAGPYSIDVEIQMTDPDTGDVYHDTITYNVPAAASGLRNDRYAGAALAGSATPPELNASLVSPSNNNHMLVARMVDANGTVVTDPTIPAYLQIIGQNGLRVGIDELDSQETGVSTTNVAGTNKGFSHYFELNNFFVRNAATTLGAAAQNLRVRQALLDDPRQMSVGGLTRVSQPSGATASARYGYEISTGSNQIAERFANLRNTAIHFVAAGGLPDTTNAISDYASDIYAYIGGTYNQAANSLTQQEIIGKTYDDRMSSVSGVNLDEELANTVLYQNAYAASARIITVVSTLFDTLLEIRS